MLLPLHSGFLKSGVLGELFAIESISLYTQVSVQAQCGGHAHFRHHPFQFSTHFTVHAAHI